MRTKLILAMVLSASVASASPEEEFLAANTLLRSGRVGEAVAAYEALADEGVATADLSFNRALAYASRVKLAEEPGDLGRAIHGFEEARELGDRGVALESERALVVLRAEVARRRARQGLRSPVSESPRVRDLVLRALPVHFWATGAMILSPLLALAIVLRLKARGARAKVATITATGVLMTLLGVSALTSFLARENRRSYRESVVITDGARPADERGVALPGLDPMPSGARVRTYGARAGWVEVEWTDRRVWLPEGSLRSLRLRPD